MLIATTRLRRLHWLPITQRINFKLATLAFKIQSTFQPEYLRQLISSQHSGSSMTMTLRFSTRPLLQAPRTRTAYAGRAVCRSIRPKLFFGGGTGADIVRDNVEVELALRVHMTISANGVYLFDIPQTLIRYDTIR